MTQSADPGAEFTTFEPVPETVQPWPPEAREFAPPSPSQQINDRRARQENLEALRLARSL
jgi:hypothetical protein